MNDRNRKDASTQELKNILRPKLAAEFKTIHRHRSRLRFVRRTGSMVLLVAIAVSAVWWNPMQPGNRDLSGNGTRQAARNEKQNEAQFPNDSNPTVARYSAINVEFLSDDDVQVLLAEQHSDWFIAKVDGEVRAFNIGKKN
jgi:ferric-dicitrate binding protein FerR (iron transport regulator)